MPDAKTEAKKKILVVDDTEINRLLLTDMLEADYEIFEATNGLEATAFLRQHFAELSLVLLDIVMPKMDGFEVLSVMHRNGWLESLPVIMISAELSSEYVDHAYDLGATDYITRPFDEKTVLRRVQNTIMLYAKQKFLEGMVTEQIMEKERSSSQMVEILSNIVEFRNGESGLHVLHIRVITDLLLQNLRRRVPEYQLTSARIALIANASAMHDIGKISIDEKILNKPGRLTPEEYEIMKTHTVIGAEMLENSPQSLESELVRVAHDICRWHHERYDGRGYPDGLVGDAIPIEAQVVALADVYDALTSPRVYKPAFSQEKAIQMILNGECGAFNPTLLDCLQDCAPELARALDIRSPRQVSAMEVQRVASELISHRELRVSGQTLTLLEQERARFQFFADLSRDVLFEYDPESRQLKLMGRGAHWLDADTISHPEEDPRVAAWNPDAVGALRKALAAATPKTPQVSLDLDLDLPEGKARYTVVLRAFWNDETGPFTWLIGMLIPQAGQHCPF